MQVTKVIKKYGYTIDEIARKAGYAHSSSLRVLVCNKKGKLASPTIATLRNIADAVGCSVGEFFDDERYTPKHTDWDGTQPPLNIARVMRLKNIGRKDLATRLGVSIQQVSAILTHQNISLTTAYNVASALNVPITELFSCEK